VASSCFQISKLGTGTYLDMYVRKSSLPFRLRTCNQSSDQNHACDTPTNMVMVMDIDNKNNGVKCVLLDIGMTTRYVCCIPPDPLHPLTRPHLSCIEGTVWYVAKSTHVPVTMN
jgi:hypothetical protein